MQAALPVLAALVATVLLTPAAWPATEEGWQPAGWNSGVQLDYRPTPSGFRAYRGSVEVCTDLGPLRRFVADAAHLDEWIPYTEEARELPHEEPEQLYYLRTSAPWPFKSRDMVYRLTPLPEDRTDTISIELEGVPDALPERHDAVRMTSAEGGWTLVSGNGRIEVTLSLAVNPGRAPAFFADRRLAATVGGTLANLARQFPCE